MNTLFLFDVSGQKIFDYLRNPQTTIIPLVLPSLRTIREERFKNKFSFIEKYYENTLTINNQGDVL